MPGELYFEKAEEYIPERWYSKPELVKDRQAHVPFGLGKSILLRAIRLQSAR